MEQPICLVGIGKIAVDQHVPAIAGSLDWTLAATVSRARSVEGCRHIRISTRCCLSVMTLVWFRFACRPCPVLSMRLAQLQRVVM